MIKNKKRLSFLELSAVIILLGILSFAAISCKGKDATDKNADSQTTVKANQSFDVDISLFTGNSTFLDMLLQVKAQYIDKDYKRQFVVVDGATYIAKLNSDFDPSVLKKILNNFGGDPSKLQQAIDSIKGKPTTPGTVYNMILPLVQNKLAAELIAPTLSLSSGAGTNLHFGNIVAAEVGYASPDSGLPNPEKTGRGYASSLPARKLLDASDCYYLNEIKILLQAGNKPAPFFGAIMDVLTQCKVANINNLDDQSRTNAGDFLAVYFAEADRNAMYNLMKFSWQKDLLHATCLASYVASAGGDPGKFWAMGVSGSGIGETRTARQQLAAQVCNAEKKINPKAYNDLQALIGTPPNGDLLQQLADFLNNQKNSKAILANADKISSAAANFMVAIHDDAQKINISGVPKDINNPNGCNK